MKAATNESASDRIGSSALFIGGLAAILASTCCLGPLVLVALGLSGAWIGNLALLEPYRPFFIAGSVVALIFAARRIFRPGQACQPGRSMRYARNSPHLQNRFCDCFSARSRCADISIWPSFFTESRCDRGAVMKNLKTLLGGSLVALMLAAPTWASPKKSP